MGLFRDRGVSSRWSLFGSPRPQPRRAKGMDSPDSPAPPPEPLDDEATEAGGLEGEETHGTSPASRPGGQKPSQRYPGLPALSAAEARARNGRGFAAIIMRRHRRARRHDHSSAHRTHVDLPAVENALDAAADSLGQGLDQAVVWDAGTGLALVGRGDAYERLAPVWHRALRDVQAALPEAGLRDPGSQHLVGLRDGRIAILLHGSPTLGACLTVHRHLVDLDDVLDSSVPRLRSALVSASGEH